MVPFDAEIKPFCHSTFVGRGRRTPSAYCKIYVAIFSSPASQDDLDGRRGSEQRPDCPAFGYGPCMSCPFGASDSLWSVLGAWKRSPPEFFPLNWWCRSRLGPANSR